MLLKELRVDNFLMALGSLYEEWEQRVDHTQTDKFIPKEYDDLEGGAFWINAYTDDVMQGQLSHVEMIRQNPTAFGLTDDGMPTGELAAISGDSEYDKWLDEHDPNDSKLKFGVFMDGWIRGSFEPNQFVEITGISPVIKKAADKIMKIINTVNPNEVIVEVMDEGKYKNKFVFPSEESKLKGFIGK